VKSSNTIFYLGTLFFSALFLFIGSRMAIGEGIDLDTTYNKFWFEPVFMPAVITEIRFRPHDGDSEQSFCADDFVNFKARIISGDLHGQYAIVARPWGRTHWVPEEEPQVGDRVLLLGYFSC